VIRIKKIKDVLDYAIQFNDKCFVVKLGGKVVKDNLDNFCEQISYFKKIGIKIIIVHGGSTQLEEFANKIGVKQKKVNGSRITDDTTLDLVKKIYSQINMEIVAKLNKHKVKSIGLNGADGLLLKAQKRPTKNTINYENGNLEKIELGHVGDVKEINIDLINQLVKYNFIPVIACLGADEKGNIYNINADFVAKDLAISLDTEKLVLMTSVDGVYNNDELISSLNVSEIDDLIKKNVAKKGMIPKLKTCKEVALNKINVHMLNGLKNDTILAEIFTENGIGTMVVK